MHSPNLNYMNRQDFLQVSCQIIVWWHAKFANGKLLCMEVTSWVQSSYMQLQWTISMDNALALNLVLSSLMLSKFAAKQAEQMCKLLIKSHLFLIKCILNDSQIQFWKFLQWGSIRAYRLIEYDCHVSKAGSVISSKSPSPAFRLLHRAVVHEQAMQYRVYNRAI